MKTILTGTEGVGRESGMVLNTILTETEGVGRGDWDGSGDYLDWN